MATDPVCGMAVDEHSAELTLVRENRSYYFCSTSCLEEFAAPARQLKRIRRRLAVAWPVSVVVAGLTYLAPFPAWPWAALLLASVVQFYPGAQFYRGTRDAIRSRLWNMDILIAVGTSVAYGYSAAALLLPGRLPTEYFFDASSLIITLILTGNYLEHFTRERARGSLRKLQELLPARALVLRDGGEEEVELSEVRSGERVHVRPGGRFPADGVVREGHSAVNESLLTGESLPVEKGPGDRVIAGAVNGEGLLTVEVTGLGEDTALAAIGRLVTDAEMSRVPLQQLADRIASVFVPTVLALGVLAALGWYFLGGVGLTVTLLVFVSVVITACPCAFGIATPAAIVVGTGRAAEEGILFKGRDSLERASSIDLVITDKTGTLTEGRPSLAELLPAAGVTSEHLLEVALSLEMGSEHPLARAVRDAGRARGLSAALAEHLVAEPGRGLRGDRGGVPIAVLRGQAPETSLPEELASSATRLDSEGKAFSVVYEAERPLGLLAFTDALSSGVPAAVRALRSDGIEVVLATGDRENAARTIAREAGISDVHAGLTPEGKLALLKEYQGRGRKVAYVGDGINDAPALAAADLGIAIGAGTEVAKEAGGVVLVRSDFRSVALALRIGRRTVGKVRGNIAWALGYNSVLLPVAAGVLVPVFGLRIFDVLPITGALAMGLSSTTVVLNSLSLRFVRLSRSDR